QERVRVDSGLGPLLVFGQHLGLGRRQYAVQAAQHGERQDDLAVLGLLVIAAEQVRDGPDEGRKSLLVQGISRFNNESGRPARDPEVRMIEAPRLSGALESMLSAATPRDSRGPASCTPGTTPRRSQPFPVLGMKTGVRLSRELVTDEPLELAVSLLVGISITGHASMINRSARP